MCADLAVPSVGMTGSWPHELVQFTDQRRICPDKARTVGYCLCYGISIPVRGAQTTHLLRAGRLRLQLGRLAWEGFLLSRSRRSFQESSLILAARIIPPHHS